MTTKNFTCDACKQSYSADSSDFSYQEEINQRPMGPETIISGEYELTCDSAVCSNDDCEEDPCVNVTCEKDNTCGNTIIIQYQHVEYPVDFVESENYTFIGGTEQ